MLKSLLVQLDASISSVVYHIFPVLFDLQVGHFCINYYQILPFLFEKMPLYPSVTFLLLFIFSVLALNLGPCSTGQVFLTVSCISSSIVSRQGFAMNPRLVLNSGFSYPTCCVLRLQGMGHRWRLSLYTYINVNVYEMRYMHKLMQLNALLILIF